MAIILSDDYRAEHAALIADPIIVTLAATIGKVNKADLAHEDGTPRFEFMLAVRDEYTARGGKGHFSMGGPARAILALI